jgi:hypothetical protein
MIPGQLGPSLSWVPTQPELAPVARCLAKGQVRLRIAGVPSAHVDGARFPTCAEWACPGGIPGPDGGGKEEWGRRQRDMEALT